MRPLKKPVVRQYVVTPAVDVKVRVSCLRKNKNYRDMLIELSARGVAVPNRSNFTALKKLPQQEELQQNVDCPSPMSEEKRKEDKFYTKKGFPCLFLKLSPAEFDLVYSSKEDTVYCNSLLTIKVSDSDSGRICFTANVSGHSNSIAATAAANPPQ